MIKKVLCLITIILGGFLIYYGISLQIDIDNQKKLEQEQNAKKIDISNHFGNFVKTIDESIIYKMEDNKYIEKGKIGKDVQLTLSNLNITHNTDYFYIEDLDYYISYKSVIPIQKLNIIKNDRYKKYVVFNENANTIDVTNLYDMNDKLVYSFYEGMSFPIIIKDDDKIYVEYKDNLYYLKKNEVEIQKSKNTTEKVRSNIRTLTYHTVYDIKSQTCTNTVICHPITQFESHMKYLSDNNYFTLTMEELEMFLDGKIRIPENSIVVTLDDGKYYKNAVEIVEKYKINATYFIITSKYDVSKTKSTYMKFESHTDNMHQNYKCPGGNQGGMLLCASEKDILKDIKTSQDKLNGSNYISYPFFDFNDRAIKLLKQSGMHLAFIGQYDSDGYSDSKTNKFMIRRKTVFSDTSLEEFKTYYLK